MDKSAFPEIHIKGGDNYSPPTKVYYGGMSLRDYFASAAMQGILAAQDPFHRVTSDLRPELAVEAYDIADKMLEQRRQK